VRNGDDPAISSVILSVLAYILILAGSAFAQSFDYVLIQSAIEKNQTPFRSPGFWHFAAGWLETLGSATCW
jgi:uncharacterized membrane protein YphA (DoxX/SURF4 family)